MISIKRIEPKNYEDMLTDAFMQIPLYTKEWTNFNPSDPGVTILENLTAFSALQQKQMGRVAEDVREKLLKLMGFEPLSGKCARVLLAAKGAENDFYLPADQRFRVGDVNFETNRRSIVYANSIKAVRSESDGRIRNCDDLIDDTSQITVKVFGDKPKRKDALYLFLEKMPLRKAELIFYFSFDDRFHRAMGDAKKGNDFAEIEWQYYTEEGFVPIKSKDNTRAFLTGGEVRFSIPDMDGAEFTLDDTTGYVIRAVLKRADYDVPPRFNSIHGFLFEVWQKETRSICHTMGKQAEIEVYCDILEEEFIRVYCKEGKEDYYRLYNEAPESGVQGRYYDVKHDAYGLYKFRLNKQKYGYGPNSDKDAVKIVAYNSEMMRQYYLGVIYGYDDQELSLPVVNVVPESFSLIAERELANGDKVYNFVKPGRKKEDSLYYLLDEREGKIVIKDAGDFVGASLYLCACAVTLGEQGNVRSGNIFTPVGYESDVVFYNPSMGEGGRIKETLDETKQRFVADINTPYTAVKEEDYEELVKKIPDLCIRKARAIAVPERNDVQIVAMPYSDKPHPILPKLYMEKMMEYLDERRVLSTGIEIIQPVYIPIDVSGTIYVKKHFENCREEIEKVITRHVDYLNGEQQFGDVLKFDSLFREIEELPCVEYIFDLSIYPENTHNAKVVGLDIQPAQNGLCYPGKYYFEINTFIE